MKKDILREEQNPDKLPKQTLDEICRRGAQRMLMQALEIEVAEYLREQPREIGRASCRERV